MNVNAKAIRNKSPETLYLRDIIRRSVQEIQDQIINAARDNLSHVRYTLQQNFDVKNLTNSVSQTYVYSNIIQVLKDNEFEVKLHLTDRENCIIVRWTAALDKKEIEYHKQVIKDALSS